MKILISAITLLLLTSCTSVKEFQKSKINDSEMELAEKKTQKFEKHFSTI